MECFPCHQQSYLNDKNRYKWVWTDKYLTWDPVICAMCSFLYSTSRSEIMEREKKQPISKPNFALFESKAERININPANLELRSKTFNVPFHYKLPILFINSRMQSDFCSDHVSPRLQVYMSLSSMKLVVIGLSVRVLYCTNARAPRSLTRAFCPIPSIRKSVIRRTFSIFVQLKKPTIVQ